MQCSLKIYFTNKVNKICGGGQLLVTRSQCPITRVPGVRIPCLRVVSPKAQGPSSRVSGSQVSGSQSPGPQSLGSQGPGLQGTESQGLRIPGLRSQDPWSQVLILGYAFRKLYSNVKTKLFLKNLLQQC